MKLRLAMLSAVVLLLPAATAADDGPAIVKQVAEAWEKRRQEIRSVRYLVKGTQFYNRGAFTEPDKSGKLRVRPETDVSLPISIEYLIDYSQGWIRRDERFHIMSDRLGKFIPKRNIDMFDGKQGCRYTPRADLTSELFTPAPSQAEVSFRGDTCHILEDGVDRPVLFAHGYLELGKSWQHPPSHFRKPPPAEYLTFRRRGRIGDRDCFVLQTQPQEPEGYVSEFWVDLERGGLVLRRNQLERNGTPYSRIDASYRQDGNMWILDAWSHSIMDDKPKPYGFIRTERLKVVEAEVNPSVKQSDFSPKLVRNMVVRLSNNPGTFQVGSDERTLVPYGRSTFIWRWWHWLSLAAVALVLLAGSVIIYRRWLSSR